MPSKHEVENEMKFLNTEILKKLLSSTSKSQNKKQTVQLSEKLFVFLKHTYKMKQNTYRWLEGSKILADFSFETERYFNQTDFCSVKDDSFKIRIFQRHLKYYGEKMVKNKKPFKHALTFKFQNLSLKK